MDMHAGRGSSATAMDNNTKGNGTMTNTKDTAAKHGRMEQSTRGTSTRVLGTGRDDMTGTPLMNSFF